MKPSIFSKFEFYFLMDEESSVLVLRRKSSYKTDFGIRFSSIASLFCTFLKMRFMCIFLFLALLSTADGITTNKLLLIIIDGLPWQIIDNSDFSSFMEMRKQGTSAEYLKPVFPSVGYPNYFSLLTGLYPEEHGIVDENMYDYRQTRSVFVKGVTSGENTSSAQWFQNGELFWTTAENQGRKIGVYGWTSCNHSEMAVGPKPDRCYQAPRGRTNWNSSYEYVDQAISELEEGAIDVALLFVDEVENAARSSRKHSWEFNCSLTDADQFIRYTRDRMENASISGSTNLLIVSIHGFASLLRPPLVVDISRYSEDVKRAVTFFPGGSRVVIYPQPGTTARLFNSLYRRHEHVHVYWKWTMPLRWRIRKGYFTPQIMVIADQGWAVASSKKEALFLTSSRGSYDGYDPEKCEDMRGVFMAVGPSFKKNYAHPPIDIVDVYNLLCNITGLRPSNNSGEWDRIMDTLDNGTKDGKLTNDSVESVPTMASFTVLEGSGEGSGEMEEAHLAQPVDDTNTSKIGDFTNATQSEKSMDLTQSGDSMNLTQLRKLSNFTQVEASNTTETGGSEPDLASEELMNASFPMVMIPDHIKENGTNLFNETGSSGDGALDHSETSGDGSGEEEASGEVVEASGEMEPGSGEEMPRHRRSDQTESVQKINGSNHHASCNCSGDTCINVTTNQPCQKEGSISGQLNEDITDIGPGVAEAEVEVHDWREMLVNLNKKNRKRSIMEGFEHVPMDGSEEGSGEGSGIEISPAGPRSTDNPSLSIRFNNRHPHAHHGIANVANVRSNQYNLKGSILVQNSGRRSHSHDPSTVERFLDFIRSALSGNQENGITQGVSDSFPSSTDGGRLKTNQFVSGGQANQLIIQQPVVTILVADKLESPLRKERSIMTGKQKKTDT